MQDLKLFFSWQSDSDTENLSNTEFLWTAIQESVAAVNVQLKAEDLRIIAEQANTGEGGDYDIYKSIYEKIDNCDIFIVDMTVGYKRISDFVEKDGGEGEGRRAKVAPNPNAYGEYHRAFARKDLSSKCRIQVANSHYGNPQKDTMLIPFDTRKNNFTIVYELKSDDQEDKDKVKNGLKDRLIRSILDAANDIKESPRTKFAPFKWWTDVRADVPNYVSTKSLETLAKKIRDNKHILVIYGKKGLGKTRLVKETLRREKISFFYLDYYRDGEDCAIHKIMRKIGESHPNSFVIVDRCNMSLLNHIIDEGEQGLPNPVCVMVDEDIAGWKVNHRLIEEMTWKGDDTLVRELLLPIKESSGEDEYNEACEECGYDLNKVVGMLNYLTPQTAQEEQIVETYEDVNITTKDKETITNAMAMFSQIGYTLGAETDWQYFLSLPIISKGLPIQHKVELFKQVVDWQFVSGGMQYSGRNIRCVDSDEAIRRAANYVDSLSEENFARIINLLLKPGCPNTLFDAFCKQMKEMVHAKNYLNKVNEILMGTIVFSDFSCISNPRGAQLMHAFVNISPIAAADCLRRCFETANDKELKAFSEGRQDIVFALSKLSFYGETFEKGARMLLRLAMNENDFAISNNSEGCFLDLFPCFLAQTEVSLDTRLKFLNEMRENQTFRKLLLKVVKRMLQSRDFIRIGGPERIGGRKLDSYQSNTYEELRSYRDWALHRVWEELELGGEYTKEAIDALCTALIRLHPYGKESLLDDLSKYIKDHPEYDWSSIKKQLRLLRERSMNEISNEDTNKIDAILKELENDSLLSVFNDVDRLFMNASGKPFVEKQKEETLIYDKLAERFAAEYDFDTLREIFTSQAPYYDFGKTLASVMSPEQREMMVNDSISILSDNPQIRPWLFVDFISNCPDRERQTIQGLLLNSTLVDLLFPLCAAEDNLMAQIDFLVNCARDHGADMKRFVWFWQRVPLSMMNKELVLHFLRVLHAIKSVDAYYAAIDVLAMLGLSQSALREPEIADFVEKWTIEEVVSLDTWINNDDFWLVMERVVDGTKREIFVQHLNQLMLSYVQDYKGYFGEPYCYRRMYTIFEDQYFPVIWPKISEYIVLPNEQFMTFYRIKSLFGAMIGGTYNSVGLLFAHSHMEEMMLLCENYPHIAPERLLLMTPAFENGSFHPLVVAILEKYYTQQNVKAALMDNLGTYGVTGSAIPLLSDEKSCFEKLRDDTQDTGLKEWCGVMITEMNQRIEAENIMEKERFERFGI